VIGGETGHRARWQATDNSGVPRKRKRAPKSLISPFHTVHRSKRCQGFQRPADTASRWRVYGFRRAHPTIHTQPIDLNVAVNGSAELTVSGSCSDGRTVAYQWYSNTVNSATVDEDYHGWHGYNVQRADNYCRNDLLLLRGSDGGEVRRSRQSRSRPALSRSSCVQGDEVMTVEERRQTLLAKVKANLVTNTTG
jgi:hypothetical protein